MAARGVEPRRLSAPDPKSGVSANFTKRPHFVLINERNSNNDERILLTIRRACDLSFEFCVSNSLTLEGSMLFPSAVRLRFEDISERHSESAGYFEVK